MNTYSVTVRAAWDDLYQGVERMGYYPLALAVKARSDEEAVAKAAQLWPGAPVISVERGR